MYTTLMHIHMLFSYRQFNLSLWCPPLSRLFLRFNPLKALQPKRRLQQILPSSPVPVPKPVSGSGTTAPAAAGAVPVPAPPA